MIVPTKRLGADRALLTVGADILSAIGERSTVSSVWQTVKQARAERGNSAVLTFDWFVLALDLLYATGLVSLERGALVRRKR